MQNTTANYKLEINKPSREFECKITIGNNIYNNDELVNLTLEHTQPQEGFSIGDTISQSLDLTLLNRGDIIYSTSQIKVEIGLKIGSTIEYILMGIFNIDDIEKTDYTTKFTAYDNMIKFETPYFSSLGDKPTLKQVVNELSKITGIEFIGSLPNYTVSKLEGFTCREVLSYVASICGGNAVITRDGKFTIKSLSEIKKSIDGNNYFDYKREEVKYKIGKISCQIDENNILYKGSTGTDSIELGFENPWVTETILNDVYNKLNGLSYLGYSMKWQGDLSLDPYDIVTVTDIKNVIRKIPILSQKISYTGGLTSEIGAKGESKNKNSFSSSGSTSNKVNRVVMEQAVIKEALINKANIRDLEASNAKIENLQVKAASIESAIIGVAYISDLTAINANIQNLIAADAKINTALINKADITELNAVQGNITSLNSQIANIQTLVNGNLSSENIQAGGITSDKLTIANGFITNAMIANLDVSKINAGDISTNKFRIVSDNGGIEIVGATQQFKDKNNKVRIQMGQDAKGNFNFILRGEDGSTTLIDHTGIKEKAIADNLIKGNMVATDAIGEKQINYSSLITGLNKDTNTQLIKASKVAIDLAGQTLDLAFNSLKNQADNNRNIIENHSTNISAMQGQISTAINNTQIVKDGKTILLKDDYNRTISKVDSINSTIGTHTTKINELTGNIISVDTKVNSVQRDLDGTKSIISSNTSEINGLNSKITTQGASISQLQNQISLKVNSTEFTTMKTELNTKIDSIQVGGRNLAKYGCISKYNTASYTTINDISSFKTNGGYTFSRTACDNEGVIVDRYIVYEAGKPYIMSFKMRALTDGVNSFYIHNGCKHTKSKVFVDGIYLGTFEQDLAFPTDGEYHKIDLYFNAGTNNRGDASNVNIVHTILQPIKRTAFAYKVQVLNHVISAGNKIVDWSPAPEDIDLAIDKKANSSDVYKKTEVYTKTQTDSAIKVAKDSINLSVSGTYETKTNVETKINTAKSNAINSSKSYTDGQITTVNKTITNKVAEIKATTDSISQKVSTTESKITTINNNISGLTNRVSTAESKLTSTSLTTTISSAISGGTSSISTTQFVMDKNGLAIKNGALTIKNKAGTTVLNSDTDGNLLLTGTVKSQSGERYVSLDSGGITFNDAHKNEQMLRVAMAYFPSNRDINGVTFAMPKYSDFIRFSHINKTNLTSGWSSTDTHYNFFDLWSTEQTIGSTKYYKGINTFAHLYIRNNVTLDGGVFNFKHSNGNTPSKIFGSTTNHLCLIGDSGVTLGIYNGTDSKTAMQIKEVTGNLYGTEIELFTDIKGNGRNIYNVNINKSLVSRISKKCSETTYIEGQYNQLRINFTDIKIVNGKAYINIPNIYLGLYDGYIISSIVKKDFGQVWIESEEERRFILVADRDMKVNVEVILKLCD